MKSYFEELGLSRKEQSTFLKLIEIGAQPVSKIAKHVSVPRPTAYVLLDRLADLELVEFFQHRGVKHARAIPVERLRELLKERRARVEQSLGSLEDDLPELLELENKLSITPKVKFYQGKAEVERMYGSIMELDGYSAFFNPEPLKKLISKYFYDLPAHYIERGVYAREIMVDCKEAYEYQEVHRSPYYQMKILPKEYTFSADMLITRERLFLISYGVDQIAGTEIFDEGLAKSQLAVFDALWDRI